MNCKICGAPLAPGEVLCRNCGASNTNIGPKAPTAEPVVAAEPVAAPSAPVAPINPAPAPVNPVEPVIQEEKLEPVAEDVKPEKKDSGKFLVIIGVVVGLLAAAVVGYLMYSSLKNNNSKKNGADITVVQQTNYNVSYGDYKFTLATDYNVALGKKMNLKKGTLNAMIGYSEDVEFSKITNDNFRGAFKEITDYRIDEIATKTYSGIPCFETKVSYTDGAKTLLLLCKREVGYWFIEIGNNGYTDYPASNVADEIVKILSQAKKEETAESKLKIDNIKIVVEETENKTEGN